MPFPADFETIAGTRLFISPTRPADNTEAAFEALTDWAEFDVTSVGSIQGREYNTAELDVVSSGQVRRKLGNYSLKTSDWGVVLDDDSDAIDIASAANGDARTVCAFAAVRQSGAVYYWTAQVSNLSDAGGGSNDAITATLSMLFQSEAFRATTPVIPDVA